MQVNHSLSFHRSNRMFIRTFVFFVSHSTDEQTEHQVYLRRELIQWSDLVKLRFGNDRDQCPQPLYDYMREYTRLVATTFDGCRLDNCHSTPIWFAQQMMDFARDLNPNFYVNAELFTGNMDTDIHFINAIGINSLVRGESVNLFFFLTTK